ncbi:hypothetical protein VT47_12710 [Pseudomonas syringae pv. syringae]|nr:hypothetical protein VT47_12710 [Pseudomonas syringae pv. syringae]
MHDKNASRLKYIQFWNEVHAIPSGMQMLSCTHKRRDLIDEKFHILSGVITMSGGNRIFALFIYCDFQFIGN